MTSQRDPRVLIVSGPSGSGKSTLVKKLLELPGTLLSISCTTRRPRSNERDGEWYNFVSAEEFERMVERGEFLEHARVFGRHSYGTPRRWFEEARRKALDLVLEIDVQGAEQVKLKLRDAVAIFILPPSRQELETRIRARGADSEEEIARRLERARQEMQCYTDYDYVVVNDDLERAGREVQAIALAARCARAMNDERIRKILDSFGG
ncbi:MAG: guanylate kinase [Acidobacteria bacterium]|nr:guanylate kinase [Acidobacteriota bacterium]MBI3662530.1 guanylate kinase [Acidobacteriota bacterium]